LVVVLKVQLRTSNGFKVTKRYELSDNPLETLLKSIDVKMLEIEAARLLEVPN